MSDKFTSRQIIQNISNGETKLMEVPAPKAKKNDVLIKTTRSLISAGTEKMLINFGKSNMVQKAIEQPNRVKEVFDKLKTDGFSSTLNAVQSKLDSPLPLGYCNVGRVINSSDARFEKGQRVVSNGFHADIVRVPKNLVCAIPDEVSDETAVFTILGSIALQGIRLTKPQVGENVVVYGLGLIGLLAIQILRANGCNVLGIDLEDSKCKLAQEYGAQTINLSEGIDAVSEAMNFSKGFGADAVLITASTKSDEIIKNSAKMCRKRGKIILVGVTGLNINRDDFYEKELSFQVSCSYGPGRYDEQYEHKGIDYPYAHVRWTENRNFQTILGLMKNKSIDISKLVTKIYDIHEYQAAYDSLNSSNTLGVILKYQDTDERKINHTIELKNNSTEKLSKSDLNIGFLGAGNYASRILIPHFYKEKTILHTIVTSAGLSAKNVGEKYKFKLASTDENMVFKDEIDAVVIATRHDLHASQALKAIKANKHVFIEKPLAITHNDIDKIEEAANKCNKILMIGFNRRFSPFIQKIKKALDIKSTPKTFIYTVNAGQVPDNHWTQDPKVGGGRIIGEACHFIDLLTYLSGSTVKSFNTLSSAQSNQIKDNVAINLEFNDGSIGTIFYLSKGAKSFPKERIEIFCDNATIQLDNFIKLKSFGWKGLSSSFSFSQNKGQSQAIKSFISAIKNGEEPPIEKKSIFDSSRLAIDIAENLKK